MKLINNKIKILAKVVHVKCMCSITGHVDILVSIIL